MRNYINFVGFSVEWHFCETFFIALNSVLPAPDKTDKVFEGILWFSIESWTKLCEFFDIHCDLWGYNNKFQAKSNSKEFKMCYTCKLTHCASTEIFNNHNFPWIQ